MKKNYKAINSNNQDNDFIQVDPKQSLSDVYGGKEVRKAYNEICNDNSFKAYQEKFKEIFTIGYNNRLKDGEIQVLISYATDGKPLDEIPYEKLNDIKQYLRDNAEHYLLFMNPELYAFLLRTNYHKKPYNQIERPNRLKRIAKIIGNLKRTKAKQEKYTKLAEIISRTK